MSEKPDPPANEEWIEKVLIPAYEYKGPPASILVVENPPEPQPGSILWALRQGGESSEEDIQLVRCLIDYVKEHGELIEEELSDD